MESSFSIKTTKISRMNSIKSQIHLHNLLILGILIIAAILRLYKISGYMTFLGDEGRDVLVVYNILHGHFTLLGPTASVGGFFLGPIYYYFMAPFLWLFNYNPVGPAVMVALFGVFTVFLVYKIGNELFDKTTGIIASVLYAISPLIIAYSRSSWNPNLMPFFSLLTLYFAFKGIEKNKILYFFLSGVFLGVAIQLHYIATFLAVILFFYLLYSDILTIKSLSWFLKLGDLFKTYLFIFLGFLLGLAPFLIFELRHSFPNARSIFDFIFNSKEVGSGGNFFAIINNVFFRLFGRLITDYPPPEQVSLNHPEIALKYYSTLILAIVVVVFFLLQYLKSFKERGIKFQKFSLIFIWFFIGISLFGFYKKSIYDYYFGFMFPLPFLLVGSFLFFLLRQKFFLKMIGAVCFTAIFIINIQAMPFRYSPNNQKAQVKTIADFVLSKADNKPFNFALITIGNSDHAYRYFFELANKKPVVIQNSQADPQRKSVTEQLLIVCEDRSCKPLGNSLWEVAGFGRAEISEEWDISVVKVYKLIHYKEK